MQEARGGLNQPSSRGSGAIYRNIVIYNDDDKIKALARWPEKRIPTMGVPH